MDNCGFGPYTYDEYYDDSDEDESDNEEKYESALEEFGSGLKDYVKSLNYKKAIEFFYGIMEVEIDFDESSFCNCYSTILLKKIIEFVS